MQKRISRHEDTRDRRAHTRRVHIQENTDFDGKRSSATLQINSILRSSKNSDITAFETPKTLKFDCACDKNVINPVEQKAADFIDELFGEWTQTIKAAMTLEQFKSSKY